MRNTLVAYFSASGITEKTARTLALALDAEMFEIRPAIPYTEADLDWRDKTSRSSVEMQDPASRPEILGILTDFDLYDTVYIGFPIWWYQAPTIINTFLESYDFTGKTVITFATSGSSGMGKTNELLAPSCPGAKLVEGRILNPPVTKEELYDWAKGLPL